MKVLASRSENLSSVPRAYMTEENELLQVVLWLSRVTGYMCPTQFNIGLLFFTDC